MSEPWSQLSNEERLTTIARSWRYVAPTALITASLGLMLLPVWLPGPVLPQIGLLGILYWASTRPDVMPPGAAFIVGLVQDLWLGQPLGLNASLLALTAWVLGGQAMVYESRPFRFGWLVAVPFVLLYQLLTWAMSHALGYAGPLSRMFWQAGTTILAYPVAVWIHAKIQRRVTDPLLYL